MECKLSLRGMAGIAHRYISDCLGVAVCAKQRPWLVRSQIWLGNLAMQPPFYAALSGRTRIFTLSQSQNECRRLLLGQIERTVREWPGA